jgi:glutaconyl-CoA/methylmalonyl-CoA decarboxylase subunit gamma
MKLHVTVDAQTFEVEVGDLNTRPILAIIDGETFEVWPAKNGNALAEAPLSAPVVVPSAAESAAASSAAAAAAAPLSASAADKNKVVVAPIPGVILSIKVKEGDTVEFGQELCVLEAMKMKNLIRANRAGKISSVSVATGDQVRHGQVLLNYTD